ncbi:MAG: hypothetical protein R3183_07015 [Oleiphilaceae bacterium]|nr:hypothetical protein [Oleiphilaceae bacterium]
MEMISGDLGPYERLAQQYDWVYANTHELKSVAYRLRSPQLTQNIDAHDAYAHHILLRHVRSGKTLAASRIIARQDVPSGNRLPLEYAMSSTFSPLPGSPVPAAVASVSEMSKIHLDTELMRSLQEDEDLIALALNLGAYALARLLFHDYLLVSLPIRQFKQFRAQGLKYEYAGELQYFDEQEATFYLDLSRDIPIQSPLHAWQQVISEQFAPYANMPILQEREAQ